MSINQEEIKGYAYLSNDCYYTYGENAEADEIHKAELLANGWKFVGDSGKNDPTGYYGVAYKNTTTGEIVIAHRGTEFDKTEDKLTDLLIGLDMLPSQFSSANQFYNSILRSAEDTEITNVGHSLGGCLSDLVAIANRGESISINAPGVKNLLPKLENYMGVEGGTYTNQDYTDRIINFDAVGDMVSHVKENVGTMYQFRLEETIPETSTFDRHRILLVLNNINKMSNEDFMNRVEEVSQEDFVTMDIPAEVVNFATDFMLNNIETIMRSNETLEAFNKLIDFVSTITTDPLTNISDWLSSHNKNLDSFSSELAEIFSIEKSDILTEIENMIKAKTEENYELDLLYNRGYDMGMVLKDGTWQEKLEKVEASHEETVIVPGQYVEVSEWVSSGKFNVSNRTGGNLTDKSQVIEHAAVGSSSDGYVRCKIFMGSIKSDINESTYIEGHWQYGSDLVEGQNNVWVEGYYVTNIYKKTVSTYVEYYNANGGLIYRSAWTEIIEGSYDNRHSETVYKWEDTSHEEPKTIWVEEHEEVITIDDSYFVDNGKYSESKYEVNISNGTYNFRTEDGSLKMGTDGNDELVGQEKGMLVGGKGDDILSSGNKYEYLELIGGEGADIFKIIRQNENKNSEIVINDFNQDEGDKLDLRNYKNIKNFSELIVGNGYLFVLPISSQNMLKLVV